MNATNYSFKVGQIDCTLLLDGGSIIGADGMLRRFPQVAEAEYRQAYAEIGLSLDEAADSFNILLARVTAETVLVDSGEGPNSRGGQLLQNMQRANLHPEDVTLIVITHAHGDHILGLLTADGQPSFPNARYVLAKAELPYWESRIANGAAEQRPILELVQAHGLRLIEMDEEIVPGLNAVPLPGHTPGHIGLLLESDGQKLIHFADLLLSPMQLAHPEWSQRFDLDTSQSVPTRRAALRQAADEDLLTLFYHLTFPGLGHVKRAEKGFVWESLVPAR